MLYEVFNSIKQAFGEEYFQGMVDDYVISNLNQNFVLRQYQKEALGRFKFYFNGYRQKQFPSQLLFHMATGSGKTLIMAANILALYQRGYRNFIFFVNSTNIIEKTKDNFLNQQSLKYLFDQKIKFGEKEVKVKEVDNFEAAGVEDINIVFTTIQGLHIRLNTPRENSLTYEDFDDKEIVLISDEAHHINTLTKAKLSEKELKEKTSWEATVERIFRANPKNIMLEFTATIDQSNQAIMNKYQDKIIFQYDLKQFRLDKYSKEIEVMQADLEPADRALQAVILSQYRRKIAEKHKLSLKPVLLFKSKTIKESRENYETFLKKIRELNASDLKPISDHSKGTVLEQVFEYLKQNKISLGNLTKELQAEFSEEKCMLLDSENVDEEKQLQLNSLENNHNEIRAIFAVNMLNEGWDVLNLFDIVRLYDTRDGQWVHGKYKPGKTTLGETQLIGRDARYFPFKLEETQDGYKRKFDEDINNELRVLETLYYHSSRNPDYITEIKASLVEAGILPEKYIPIDLFFKEDFKKSDFWQKGIIYLNDRVKNDRRDIFSLADAHINLNQRAEIKSGESYEELLLEKESFVTTPNRTKKIFFLTDFEPQIIRTALDQLEFYRFINLKQYFPHLQSISEFIASKNYLGKIKVEVSGQITALANLSTQQKLAISLSVLKKIASEAKTGVEEFIGTKLFKVRSLKDVFKDSKVIKLAKDDKRAQEIAEIDLAAKEWFAQNNFYGTSEEQGFINFFESSFSNLKKQYSEIALIRNERYFKIFDFTAGRAFEPDFLLLLKKNGSTKVSVLQVFIEPKGNLFIDNEGKFETGKEAWKQQFLMELEKDSDIESLGENKRYKLIGLPFFNESMKNVFEDAFEEKLLC